MAFYMDEEQAWKCPKHPSKRRRSTGICAKCLRERLVTLCPDCAGDRPCGCCPAPVDSSSSSSTSSSSFSLFSFSRGGSRRDSGTGTGTVDSGRLSNNLEADPTLRKSRSVAVSFLRSRSRYVGNGTGNGGGGDGCDTAVVTEDNKASLPKVSRSKINFWSVFTVNKSKKCDAHGDVVDELNNKSDDLTTVDDNHPVMMRSRSVAVGSGNGFAPATATAKQKGWYFPSPIKGFRHSKPPRSVAVA